MKSTTSTLLTILAAVSLVAAACGGSDSGTIDSTASDANATEAVAAEPAETEEQDESAPEESDDSESTNQSATVTLSTGEVFELIPTSCKNQNTDPNDLLNDEFVDLSARNDDGYRFGVLNARVAGQDPAPTQVELSAKRDENGVNPKVSYIAAPGVIEATTMTIDGTRVTGETTIDARFSPEKPFGEEVLATFEFNC